MSDRAYAYIVGPAAICVLIAAWFSGHHAATVATTGLIIIFLARYGIKWSWPDNEPRPSLRRTIVSLVGIAAIGAAWAHFFP